MDDALTSALSSVAEFVPRLLVFLVILVAGFFVAKALGAALGALLTRVGFDRAVEKGGVKRALANSELDASDLVGRLIFYTLMLFVLQLAFGVFGSNPISDLIGQVITFLPSLIVAIVILVVASAIAAAVKTLVEGTFGGLSYGSAVAKAAAAFILFLGVVAALEQVGVATAITTPLLVFILATLGGVVVVGVGGGLVKPMQQRWEDYLTRAEAEAPRITEQARQAPSVREQAEQQRSRLGEDQPAPYEAEAEQRELDRGEQPQQDPSGDPDPYGEAETMSLRLGQERATGYDEREVDPYDPGYDDRPIGYDDRR